MDEPAIVHFTGPVHPSVAEVLNPFVQPYSAKPWGYAGAPGHPYTEEWWAVLEQTGWKGWRSSEERKEYGAREREKASEWSVKEFERWAKLNIRSPL